MRQVKSRLVLDRSPKAKQMTPKIGDKFTVTKEAIADFIDKPPIKRGSRTTGYFTFQEYSNEKVPTGSVATYLGNDDSRQHNNELWKVLFPDGRILKSVYLRNWRWEQCLKPQKSKKKCKSNISSQTKTKRGAQQS